jgi:hypothetical protein
LARSTLIKIFRSPYIFLHCVVRLKSSPQWDLPLYSYGCINLNCNLGDFLSCSTLCMFPDISISGFGVEEIRLQRAKKY